MPLFRQRVVLAVRSIRAFVNLEAGVVRGMVPESGAGTPPASGGGAAAAREASGAGQVQRIEQLRRELGEKNRENARLRSRLVAGSFGLPGGDVKPENVIWMFGSGRTGSSWLSTMMGDLEGHARWNEPYVGELLVRHTTSGPETGCGPAKTTPSGTITGRPGSTPSATSYSRAPTRASRGLARTAT